MTSCPHNFADVGNSESIDSLGYPIEIDKDLRKMDEETSIACVHYLAKTSSLEYLRGKRLDLIRAQMNDVNSNPKLTEYQKDRALGNLEVMERHTIQAIDLLAFGKEGGR